MKHSDIDPEKWNACREEMKGILIQRAKEGRTIAYSEVAREVKTIRFDMESVDYRNLMAHMLGEISVEENRNGRGMLSVIVVRKTSDQEPGQGFFELAESLGRDVSDGLKFWVEEVKAVHSYWTEK